MKVYFTKLDERAKTPAFSYENAGIDMYPLEDVEILPNTWVEVPTGIAIAFPEGVHAMFAGRSGLAFKERIFPFYGIIDSGYRGEIKCLLNSQSSTRKVINSERAFAQLVLFSYKPMDLTQIEFVEITNEEFSLLKTERGVNGFGSTDTNPVTVDDVVLT